MRVCVVLCVCVCVCVCVCMCVCVCVCMCVVNFIDNTNGKANWTELFLMTLLT